MTAIAAIFLGVVIAMLGFFLYVSIATPGKTNKRKRPGKKPIRYRRRSAGGLNQKN